MDRRYGGDPSAPPRPPKSIPRIHRPRAADPPIMNANPFQSTTPQIIQQQRTTLDTDADTLPPLQPRNQQLHQIPPPLPPQHIQHEQLQSNHLAPITVPLTSSTSFARRRPPPPGTALPIISSLSSSSLASSSTNTASSPTPPLQTIINLNSQQIETQISPVTLAAPRPEKERLANEYVDTPFRTPKLASRLQHGLHTTTNTTVAATQSIPGTTTTAVTSTTPAISNDAIATKSHIVPFVGRTASAGPARIPVRPSVLPVSAITKQPLPFVKDSSTAALHEDVDIHPSNGEPLNSITCPQCKRCRCEECQRPRQLPSRWVCDNTCLCSAETIIDYTSCLCCVKALFYHCSKDHEIECEGDSISCADDPCSCLPHKRTQRWAWLSALSLALPCLWFYWPMRGCVAICAKCYARHLRHGCRCPVQNLKQSTGINNSSGNNSGTNSGRTINRTGDLTPEKRLLDSSPEF